MVRSIWRYPAPWTVFLSTLQLTLQNLHPASLLDCQRRSWRNSLLLLHLKAAEGRFAACQNRQRVNEMDYIRWRELTKS